MALKKAELICTGSELLSYKNNRYVPLFASRLRNAGFRLQREHCVSDDRDAIAKLVACGLKNAELLITCGGLGPTFDDLTRQGIAKALGRKLVFSKTAEQKLRSRYAMASLPPNMKNQCLAVSGAELIDNENGSAFGEIIEEGGKMIVVLPGPEGEWRPMFDASISAKIREFFRIREGTIRSLRLKIAGLWETEVERKLSPVMRRFPGADYTVLAGPYTAEFIFTVEGKSKAETDRKFAAVEAACAEKLGDTVYGSGDDTLEGTLGRLLKEKGRTLSLAESCTGGGAADAVTDIPGSSAYFLGGVTAYSNAAKTRILGVKESVLKAHGAVSAECARAMAEGARRVFRSDYAASVTGIAGPEGGTPEKPVGLVYFGIAGPKMKTAAFRMNFRHNRTHIKRCSVNFVLDILRKIIQ